MNTIYFCNGCGDYVTGNAISPYIGSGILLPYRKECNVHRGVALEKIISPEELLCNIANDLNSLKRRVIG